MLLTYEIIFLFPHSVLIQYKRVSFLFLLLLACLFFFFFFQFSKQSKKSITCTAPCEVFHTRNSASIPLFYFSPQFFLLGIRLWPRKTVGCCWNDLNTVTIKRTSWITNLIASCKQFFHSETWNIRSSYNCVCQCIPNMLLVKFDSSSLLCSYWTCNSFYRPCTNIHWFHSPNLVSVHQIIFYSPYCNG